MSVCVIHGAGFVGLITGRGLVQIEHWVINVDVEEVQLANQAREQAVTHL